MFRILGDAIVGYEYWTKANKPVRSRDPFHRVPGDAKVDEKTGNFQKHFWAFLVWNYEEKRVQVLEITQTTVMTGIEFLMQNPKWGNPTGYDIVVKATGDGFEREYTTVPEPHTPAPVVDISKVVLDELFIGGDPFAPSGKDTGTATERPTAVPHNKEMQEGTEYHSEIHDVLPDGYPEGPEGIPPF